MEFNHIPVMLDECIEGLDIKENGIYVDATLGGAGHSLKIVERLTNGRLIANDLDGEAIKAAKERLTNYLDRVTFIQDDYKVITTNLEKLGIKEVDGILIDMGISSYQIDNAERGFSYIKDAPLDMRMDKSGGLSAYDVINTYSEQALTNIFFEYGEERFSKGIAAKIVRQRASEPIKTTLQLADLVARGYPFGFKDGHPAKRVFQAVRIEVNSELTGLDDAIRQMVGMLREGGRMAVMTFHSLEDRIIKNVFRDLESSCICHKSLPVCVCNKVSQIKLITKKPITASSDEIADNKRSQSAKLRVIQKK